MKEVPLQSGSSPPFGLITKIAAASTKMKESFKA
jgi:hypothetical protein